jgi:hypothetical protein
MRNAKVCDANRDLATPAIYHYVLYLMNISIVKIILHDVSFPLGPYIRFTTG